MHSALFRRVASLPGAIPVVSEDSGSPHSSTEGPSQPHTPL